MWVYGIVEYNKKEYEDMYCDRVVIFNLLRSNVWLIIKDDNIIVEQQIHCNEFYNDSITKLELESAKQEKSAIEFWTKIHKQQLVEDMPIREIIDKHTKGFDDTLIVRNEKMTVMKLEYARDKVKKEYDERKERILNFANGYENEIVKDYVARVLGVNEYARGTQTVRFHIPIIKKGAYYEPLCKDTDGEIVDSIIDIHIDGDGICQVNGSLTNEDYNVARYFCHKYFERLIKEDPVCEIIQEDDGEIINYKKISKSLRKQMMLRSSNHRKGN